LSLLPCPEADLIVPSHELISETEDEPVRLQPDEVKDSPVAFLQLSELSEEFLLPDSVPLQEKVRFAFHLEEKEKQT
jgi:hypothetical protein